MRDIKFRAWSKEKKAFIAGFNMINFHSYYNKGLEPEIYRYSTTWKLSEIELMQYTGLKDKNGKEIYEGDIVNIVGGAEYYGLRELDATGVVTYEGTSFCIVDKSSVHYPMDLFAIDEIKIIGNIYETPELLKTNEHA